jgi:hypothetical protein
MLPAVDSELYNSHGIVIVLKLNESRMNMTECRPKSRLHRLMHMSYDFIINLRADILFFTCLCTIKYRISQSMMS